MRSSCQDNGMRVTWDVKFEQNAEFTCELIASQLRILLYEQHAQSSAKLESQLSLIVDPPGAKAAIVKCKIPKHGLRLFPVSQQVHCGKKVPAGALDLGHMATIGDFSYTGYVCASHKKASAQAASSSDVAESKHAFEFFAPFWCVQPTTKSCEVNMAFEVSTVSKAGNHAHCGDYQVTALVNSKELCKGDVLRYAADPKSKYPQQSCAKKRKA